MEQNCEKSPFATVPGGAATEQAQQKLTDCKRPDVDFPIFWRRKTTVGFTGCRKEFKLVLELSASRSSPWHLQVGNRGASIR
jgi:hypothetical protein